MLHRALATDYDGTLACDGLVDETTVAALRRLKAANWKLLLVTGRETNELLGIFPGADLFDAIVAENGAVLYRPATRSLRQLAEPPPPEFLERLRQLDVHPLTVGRVIVATHEPFEVAVLEVIRELGLELQVIFNKGSVMVLPGNVNKATGLRAALQEVHVPAGEVVGVGDAENDHAFLDACGLSAAVANALPALKAHADIVTQGERGAGVAELIGKLLAEQAREAA